MTLCPGLGYVHRRIYFLARDGDFLFGLLCLIFILDTNLE
jgi:hypothetical protein